MKGLIYTFATAAAFGVGGSVLQENFSVVAGLGTVAGMYAGAALGVGAGMFTSRKKEMEGLIDLFVGAVAGAAIGAVAGNVITRNVMDDYELVRVPEVSCEGEDYVVRDGTCYYPAPSQ